MNEQTRISGSSTAISKGQTTIPKQVREALGIQEGTPLNWVLEDGILRVSARSRRVEEFAGMLGKPPNGRSLKADEFDDAVADAVSEDFGRSEE